MSSPPKYEPRSSSSEAIPFLSKAAHLDNEDSHEPIYPPRQGAGTSSAGRKTVNMTYTFKPVYPVKGEETSVLGILGHDRESTTEIVQRAFPILAEYPSDRIEFQIPIQVSAQAANAATSWGRVLDEAWDHIHDNPPARLRVMVTDGPGDATARMRHEVGMILIVLGVIFSIFAIFFAVVILVG